MFKIDVVFKVFIFILFVFFVIYFVVLGIGSVFNFNGIKDKKFIFCVKISYIV